jgi:hypothetical protein
VRKKKRERHDLSNRSLCMATTSNNQKNKIKAYSTAAIARLALTLVPVATKSGCERSGDHAAQAARSRISVINVMAVFQKKKSTWNTERAATTRERERETTIVLVLVKRARRRNGKQDGERYPLVLLLPMDDGHHCGGVFAWWRKKIRSECLLLSVTHNKTSK